MPISKNQTDILHVPYYRCEAISTSVLLRWDFSCISHAKIPVKACFTKRQEKPHNIPGSLRSTLLTLTKLFSANLPCSLSWRGKPFPTISQAGIQSPRATQRRPFNPAPPRYTAGLNIHGRNTVCLLLQLVHIFTEDKLNNLRLLSGDKSIGSRHFGKQHKS